MIMGEIVKINLDKTDSKIVHSNETYDVIDNTNLDKLIVSTGPGSFTSLRVGISFMYGQSISKDVPFYGISSTKLLNYSIKKNNYENTLLLICSANNQNFISQYIDYLKNIIGNYSVALQVRNENKIIIILIMLLLLSNQYIA